MRALLSFLLVTVLAWPAIGAKRPMKIEDLFRIQRVNNPKVSPDGQSVVYEVSTPDVARNEITTALWVAPTHGGNPRRLTSEGKKDKRPRWSPDGKTILFESNRSGDSQLWLVPAAGGDPRQLTKISTEAGNAVFSPDGKTVAFVSSVWPEYSSKPFAESDALNKKRREEKDKSKVKARVFTRLFLRHWDDWVEDKRVHLFLVPVEGGDPRDLTPGDGDASATSDTFSDGDDFAFSPDGKTIVYTAPPVEHEAWTTNYDLWSVPVEGGTPRLLTGSNPAADNAPRFSPSGKWLAYRAQKRPGFESDRWQIMLRASDGSGQPRSLTASFDGSPGDVVWGADDHTLYFIAEENGRAPLFRLNVDSGKLTKLLDGDTAAAPSLSKDGKVLALTRSSLTAPAEVFAVREPATTGSAIAENVSHANTKWLDEIALSKGRSVTVKGAGGTPMQMWILEPPGFDPARKWPLAYLVHGGPQSAWTDSWGYRWAAPLWAAQGYVVALPNPRGSTGFGQKYVDEISHDWGGKCFQDLMAGAAYLARQPYIDRARMGAAGASFGGYMMDWFEGHPTPFKALISHSGISNLDSMYGTTEELWFAEWELGGTPSGKRALYDKFSPHRYARNFKTPMLVIQNDQDFRVPFSEGLQMFTTLQRQGVPSRMINFPDEGHWVLKPANSTFWHEEVFAWLKRYVPPGPR